MESQSGMLAGGGGKPEGKASFIESRQRLGWFGAAIWKEFPKEVMVRDKKQKAVQDQICPIYIGTIYIGTVTLSGDRLSVTKKGDIIFKLIKWLKILIILSLICVTASLSQ